MSKSGFSISATLKYRKEFKKKLKARMQKQEEKILKSLVANGNRIRNEAIKSLRVRTPGKLVTRYGGAKGKRSVIVSPPLSAPNPDTKRALKSVGIEVNEKKFEVKVGTNLVYLAALEYNSRRTRRKARPWLRPAWRAWKKKYGEKFKDEITLSKKG